MSAATISLLLGMCMLGWTCFGQLLCHPFTRGIPSNATSFMRAPTLSKLVVCRRLWVQDTWASDVPDTMALIPRHFSDIYFSLHAMYADRRVGCLGGPNFNPVTVTTDHLKFLLNYSDDQTGSRRNLFNKISR
jgi:hypothetical protein